ncbi:feruloyl esterase [Polymorphobacter multimanifer]|uniref:Feruloyl esterase n=1 Tax=Polymorphobacter multimanifer TaxID=1070431 RepID=A0A841L303_9SPHN|nr:feruloyl esterase [Polymorphobacter multimanifer]
MRTLGALLLLLGASPAVAETACAGLTGVALDKARVTGAEVITSLDLGSRVVPLAAPACRVLITATPTADSDIRIALVVPQGAAWNGKFAQVGNGGFAGKILWGSVYQQLAKGYAVAATDNGHQDDDGASAKWALGHPEKVVDFGWRAVKLTTDHAQAVLAAHRGAPAKRYFIGCSDGGREALMTAQRFPQDFDGIVAGAPAWPWTRMVGTGALVVKQSLLPGRVLPPAKLPALQAAALKACGEGQSYVPNPRACRFDPGVLACAGAESDACLTPGQVTTARMIYAGITDPVTGKPSPGLMPGAEALPGSWAYWGRAIEPGDRADATSAGFPWNYMAYLVREDPTLDLASVTEADVRAGFKRWRGTLDAESADLSAFKARGGKLIGFHGWNDPAIPPLLTRQYFDMVAASMGDYSDFARLFMVPGMLHCTGGDAPVGVDWTALLEAWVERGDAPAAVTARGGDGRSQVVRAE